MHTFETTDPVTLVVRAGGGHVTVAAQDTAHTTVELAALNGPGEEAVHDAVVEQRDGVVLVDVPRRAGLFRHGPSVAISVACPRGSGLEVGTEAADIRATGAWSAVVLSSGSGDIAVETVTGSARLRTGSGAIATGGGGEELVVATGSGDVSVERSGSRSTLTTGSGDISIRELAGDVVTKTGSGDVRVERLDGSLHTKSGSGRLIVRRAESGAVHVNVASGSVDVGIEEGTAAWLDVSTISGKVSQELGETEPPGPDRPTVEITAHTVSGNLRIHRS